MKVAALLLMAALMAYEVARYLGWVDIESTVLRQYHVPVMLIAIGAAIFERHVLAVWRIERTNIDLERRVEEKAREIEAYHNEREAALRQQALADERHRIVTDMHDGLGASLVGLLRYVQSKPGDNHSIEQRVKEALQEMRIAIDALEPAQGDLAVVAGKLRYRLAPLMEAVGVRLAWEVADLPRVRALEPSAVFAIQRAVVEAISNALKHSGAQGIKLYRTAEGRWSARSGSRTTAADSSPTIRQQDFGMGNMRARAHQLGGRVEIASRRGGGTTVIFTIPYTVASEPAVSARDRTVIAEATAFAPA